MSYVSLFTDETIEEMDQLPDSMSSMNPASISSSSDQWGYRYDYTMAEPMSTTDDMEVRVTL